MKNYYRYRPKSIEEAYASVLDLNNYFWTYLDYLEKQYWWINSNCYYDKISNKIILADAINNYTDRIFHIFSYAFYYLYPCPFPKKKNLRDKYETNAGIFYIGLNELEKENIISNREKEILLNLKEIRNEMEHYVLGVFNGFIFENRYLILRIINTLSNKMCIKVNEISTYKYYDSRYTYLDTMDNFFESYNNPNEGYEIL